MSDIETTTADRPSVHVHAGGADVARPGINEHTILWVDNVSVSFEGFRALTDLTIALDPGSCAASSARTAPAKPR